MFLDKLNEDTYLFFAIRHYYNPSSSTKDDFYEDLKRFKYVQRHLKKYVETGDIKLHLLINHIIILYNVFDDAATPMLYYKSKEEYWSAIKTIQMFFVFLAKGGLQVDNPSGPRRASLDSNDPDATPLPPAVSVLMRHGIRIWFYGNGLGIPTS